MKERIITILLLTVGLLHAQSNKEIAEVYIKKAEKSYQELEIENSLNYFDKAIHLLDSITDPKVAKLGTLIHNELTDYDKAKSYAKHYFSISEDKKSEDYQQLLVLYVDIEEKIEEERIAEEKRLIEERRIREEDKIRRKDSLRAVWKTKSNSLSLDVDRIYELNEYKVALFEKDGKFGIVSDKGDIIIRAEEYKHAKVYDGYFLLMNSESQPSKVYCYNSKTEEGFSLPDVSSFNPTSTHYGQIMLPRGNGIVVSYPNNSSKILKYDLSVRKIIEIANTVELFKGLKKGKVIGSYKKEGQVKVGKSWYEFGGHVGGGIHPLFRFDKSVYGYLCSIDGSVLNFKDYNYIGAYYNKKAEVIKGDESYWINQNGTKVKSPKDESGAYSGDTSIIRLENGKYQFHRNIEGKELIILGDKALETLTDFINTHTM